MKTSYFIFSVAALLISLAPGALAEGQAPAAELALKTVVLDAGHGGRDPGCVSGDGKTYEKVDRHSPTDHPEIKHKEKPKPNAAGYAAPQTSFATAAHRAPASVPAVGGSGAGVLPAAANIAAAPAAPSEGDDDYPF